MDVKLYSTALAVIGLVLNKNEREVKEIVLKDINAIKQKLDAKHEATMATSGGSYKTIRLAKKISYRVKGNYYTWEGRTIYHFVVSLPTRKIDTTLKQLQTDVAESYMLDLTSE